MGLLLLPFVRLFDFQFCHLIKEITTGISSTGCPKSSFLYFISLYFSTIGLGKQIVETKFVFQSNSPFSYLLCQFFDSNIRFVHFRAKGARARVYFPATYFLYFIARIARTPSLFFVNITKDKTPERKNVQLKLF